MIETVKNEIIRYSSSGESRNDTNFLLRKRALESLAIFRQLYRQANNCEELQEVAEQAHALKTLINYTTTAIIQRYRPYFSGKTASAQELRTLLNRFTAYRSGASDAVHYAEENLDYSIIHPH